MHNFKVKSLRNGHIFFGFAFENLFSALMSRKGAKLSTETKELIITLSESVKNKAELSRMLNIPRTTIILDFPWTSRILIWISCILIYIMKWTGLLIA